MAKTTLIHNTLKHNGLVPPPISVFSYRTTNSCGRYVLLHLASYPCVAGFLLCTDTKNLLTKRYERLNNSHRRTWCCYLLCFCCFGFQRREGVQGLLLFLSVLVVGNVLWFPFVFRCRLFCRIADDDSAERYHGFWQFQHLTEGFYPVFHRIDPRPDSAQSH